MLSKLLVHVSNILKILLKNCRLFTNSTMAQMNMKGNCGKMAFSTKSLFKVILGKLLWNLFPLNVCCSLSHLILCQLISQVRLLYLLCCKIILIILIQQTDLERNVLYGSLVLLVSSNILSNFTNINRYRKFFSDIVLIQNPNKSVKTPVI